ncbi:hypothetical protein ACO0SA_001192 [Hanseniaspora valbyensis]
MPNSSDQFFLKESIPLYKKISDYELLLNQLVYKIDKSTLNLDQISDTNKTNDYTLLQKIIDLDSEITDKFPYKKYDEINKSYETIKTELDETNGELKDKILMTLYKNYKKLNEIKSFQSKTTLLKDIPLNTVINYSQRLSKFTSKPQITIIDQSIIGEDIPQQQQQQDPSGWNFIWAGDDMIRRGNLVVQQQQSQIKQQKIKLEEEAKQLEARKKQQEEENHNKMAATAAKNAGDGMIFDGKHKEVDEVPEQENKVVKDEEIASDADFRFRFV